MAIIGEILLSEMHGPRYTSLKFGIEEENLMADEYLGVGVIVLNEQKTHFLAGKRQNCYGAGYYGMPGGRVNFGERVADAAAREAKEEAGIELQSFKAIGAVRDYRPNEYSFIHFGFVADGYAGQPRNVEPEFCQGWEWLPLDGSEAKFCQGIKRC